MKTRMAGQKSEVTGRSRERLEVIINDDFTDHITAEALFFRITDSDGVEDYIQLSTRAGDRAVNKSIELAQADLRAQIEKRTGKKTGRWVPANW